VLLAESGQSFLVRGVADNGKVVFSSRLGSVLIVNRLGSSPRRTSDHLSGVETVAPCHGRTQYGATIDWPRMFRVQSRWIRPWRPGLKVVTRLKVVTPGTAGE